MAKLSLQFLLFNDIIYKMERVSSGPSRALLSQFPSGDKFPFLSEPVLHDVVDARLS